MNKKEENKLEILSRVRAIYFLVMILKINMFAKQEEMEQ
jgi:hypothetical protein